MSKFCQPNDEFYLTYQTDFMPCSAAIALYWC